MSSEKTEVIIRPPNVALMILAYAVGAWFGTWSQFYTPESVGDWMRKQPAEVRNAVYDEREVNEWLDAQPKLLRHDMVYAWLDDDQRQYIALKYCMAHPKLCAAAKLSAPVTLNTTKGDRRGKKSTK